MSSKFQTALLLCIAIVVVMLYMRRPEKQIPIVQDIQVTQPEERSITVSGEGEVVARLDKAEFIIVLSTDDKELADAKMKNEESYENAVAILGSHGVETKDIDGGYLRVEVRTAYTTAANNKPFGYIVHRTVRVTARHVEDLEPLFRDLQETGIYEIKDIILSVSNIEEYREQALQFAIENAGNKANAICRKINQEIGQVISIQALDANYSDNTYTHHYASLASFLGRRTDTWQEVLPIPEVTVPAHVTALVHKSRRRRNASNSLDGLGNCVRLRHTQVCHSIESGTPN